MTSGRRLIRVGAVGSLVTALCCFTPVLVWLFGWLGLSAILGYLDYVLLPLLLAFLLLLVIGVVRYGRGQ
ncbi:mercury resistance system transport protein MerF [Marinobacter sp. SS21]|uniref:mercury resistance system transport protein MerF n=1 Tax=Marinobacter sp. SS21 TaxID=2979460 RepID=UPI002330D2B6|nr:mercury resistance system transport protein MerF [Marinobacter sp. SS21]MDC0662539.1 mercury resistance system transport protein MerF [Marinobacter sp. SS21]